jgi:hypothetical protein
MTFNTNWKNPSGCEYLCLGCDRDCCIYLDKSDRTLPTQPCDGTKEGGEKICEGIDGKIPEPVD